MPHLNLYGRGLSLRIAILFTCQLSFALYGYNQGIFSGIVGNENFLGIVHHPGAVLVGFIVSIYNLGCCAGAIVAFLTSDTLGFCRSMWQAVAWVLVGAVLQASSFSTAQLLVARFVAGIGVGIMTTVVPVYQAELCEARKRGMYVCSQPLFVGVGIVLAYWFDYGMSYVDGPLSWRLPLACQGVFVIIIGGMVLGLPENPRWLYRKGKSTRGFQVLCDFYDCTTDDPKVLKESQGIQRAIELDALRGEYRWSQLFQKDELRTGRRVLLAFGLQFMNQMCGVNMIVSYVTSIFETNIGLDKKTSLLMGGVIQFMFIIGSFYPTFFVDRLGRRKPMLWGSFGLFFCMMMISILLSFKGTIIQRETASASMAFFFLFMLTFGASFNCIPWVYGPELLPLHVRSKGTAISIAANWLWNFFISMISPTLIQNLAWKGYLIFMCFNLVFVPTIYFFYPETATLTLEQIDSLFITKRGSPPDEEHSPHNPNPNPNSNPNHEPKHNTNTNANTEKHSEKKSPKPRVTEISITSGSSGDESSSPSSTCSSYHSPSTAGRGVAGSAPSQPAQDDTITVVKEDGREEDTSASASASAKVDSSSGGLRR